MLTRRTPNGDAMNPEDEEELGFYRKYRYLIWLGVAVLLIAPITLIVRTLSVKEPPAKVAPINFVKLLPPVSTPTPPPPTPQSTPRPQEKMLEQKHMDEPETKPQHPDDKPKQDSKKPAAPGPSGPSSNSRGPANGPGWLAGSGGNGGGGGGGGTRFGWYAAEVQSRIQEALHQNNKTRTASISGVRIRIWADNTARVTRAQIVGSTGDPSIDSAINEVLNGLQFKEPPPSDMPMPIVIQVIERRST